jgi:hypothetical protein
MRIKTLLAASLFMCGCSQATFQVGNFCNQGNTNSTAGTYVYRSVLLFKNDSTYERLDKIYVDKKMQARDVKWQVDSSNGRFFVKDDALTLVQADSSKFNFLVKRNRLLHWD